jgi:hypothetical protein
MNLPCVNCGQDLVKLREKRLRCPECHLHHFLSGEPDGWVVTIGGIPGGIVRYRQLLPFRVGRPLDTSDVSHFIRLAAQVGLQNPAEIKRLEAEDDEFLNKELELEFGYPKETFCGDWDT